MTSWGQKIIPNQAVGTGGVAVTLASVDLVNYSALMGAVGVTLGVGLTLISIVNGVDAFVERRRKRRQEASR